jgi:hypothetical protein
MTLYLGVNYLVISNFESHGNIFVIVKIEAVECVGFVRDDLIHRGLMKFFH